MSENRQYKKLIHDVYTSGEVVNTRNHEVYSNIFTPNVILTEFPLVTLRKTAWKKAIKEMEWFMSGNEKCPNDLKDWWSGQLSKDECLLYGYSKQFRKYSDPSDPTHVGKYYSTFDQVKFILDGLRNNPNSRRLLMSSWHSGEMSRITQTNDNKNTPTSCHSIIVQFYVRNETLSLFTYQRSADMLLGVPHNWVQTWAMMMYFAHHANLKPGCVRWCFGDAHIYKEESHTQVAESILSCSDEEHDIKLIYDPVNVEYDENEVPAFKSNDFYIDGNIPEPMIKQRPKLI